MTLAGFPPALLPLVFELAAVAIETGGLLEYQTDVPRELRARLVGLRIEWVVRSAPYKLELGNEGEPH